MPTAPPDNWLATFQELMRNHLPPLENTLALNAACLAAVLAGVFLALKSWKFERAVVALFGLLVGAWLGAQLAGFIDFSAPIPAALGAVLVTILAYKTYKWWLAIGSVLVLFWLAVILQLGRGNFQHNLLTLLEKDSMLDGDQVRLRSKDEQEQNLYQDWRGILEKIRRQAIQELRDLSFKGWIVPVAAAIAGGLLAYLALRAFVVIWLGLIGSVLAVAGASTFSAAHWEAVRDRLIESPQIPLSIAIGLWLLGLVYQAKEIRLPRKTAPDAAKDSAKS